MLAPDTSLNPPYPLPTAQALVAGHPSYVKYNPNGNNTGVDAIGHLAPQGGGSLNAYGAAFFTNGLKWDLTLACLDSDKDSFTNGIELGDGCGVWNNVTHVGGLATTGLSQPGNATSFPPNRNNACPVDPCTSPEVVAKVAALEAKVEAWMAKQKKALRGEKRV